MSRFGVTTLEAGGSGLIHRETARTKGLPQTTEEMVVYEYGQRQHIRVELTKKRSSTQHHLHAVGCLPPDALSGSTHFLKSEPDLTVVMSISGLSTPFRRLLATGFSLLSQKFTSASFLASRLPGRMADLARRRARRCNVTQRDRAAVPGSPRSTSSASFHFLAPRTSWARFVAVCGGHASTQRLRCRFAEDQKKRKEEKEKELGIARTWPQSEPEV